MDLTKDEISILIDALNTIDDFHGLNLEEINLLIKLEKMFESSTM